MTCRGGRREGERLAAIHPGVHRGLARLVVEVRHARGHPEPAGGSRPSGSGRLGNLTLSLVPSYAALCAAQAATVAAPARQARPRGRSWIWLAVPAALLGAGVAIIDLVPQGPHALALLATFGTPLLAATGGFFKGSPRWWLWPPAAVGLWLVAWLASGLLRGRGRRRPDRPRLPRRRFGHRDRRARVVDPRRPRRPGRSRRHPRLGNAERAERDDHAREPSHSPTPPACRCRTCSRRPSARRSWAGSTCSLPRCSASSWPAGRSYGAAVITGIAADLWGLLLLVTSEVAATVPVLAGLAFAAARCASQSSPTSTRTCTRWRRSSRRSRRRRLTSSGASATSSATGRGRTSAAP